MAESELAKTITRLVKATDKLVLDLRKVVEAAVELKEMGKKDDKKDS